MSGTHSILSPSKGAMILRCAAALAAGKDAPNPSSQYAAEGTAYHELAARVLQGWPVTSCAEAVGVTISTDGYVFTIDEENAAHAQTYCDAIRRLPGALYVEVRLDTSEVVGVPGQGGTGDAVVLDFEHDTIHVDDLKFGRGEVVFAENNEQLLQYGAAALRKFALSHDWKFLKVAIHQPRINHYSEHTYPVHEVEEWVATNKSKFQRAYALYQEPEKITAGDYVPGDKQCRWCPIRGKCAARANEFLALFPVTETVSRSQLMTDDEIAAARDRVDAIEQWCADIKAEAHTRGVLLGRHLPGWKVVNGRMGNRKWGDELSASGHLVPALGDAAYKPKVLVSPADAEKLLKKSPDIWAPLSAFIVQAEASKSLVRDDSPKLAVATNRAEFPLQVPV